MNNVILGEKPSEEDEFYKNWGWETLKETISTLNETLKLFIALDAAILSAFLGFYSNLTVPTWSKTIIIAFLFISLCSSIIGVYPFTKEININVPEEVKNYKKGRARSKGICLIVSSLSLMTGFLTFILLLVMN